ncbi:MAG: hypothetical protein OXD48_07340, partial [Litoreibacter sp.]|nr:hypothetical protein [Litoreibacter sp.]
PADTASRLHLREPEAVLLVEDSTVTDRNTVLSYSVTWFNTARVDIRFSAERPETMDFLGQIPDVAKKPFPPAHVSAHLSGLHHRQPETV